MQENQIKVQNEYTLNQMLFDQHLSGRINQIAETISKGRMTTPDHLKGNMPDCIGLTIKAIQWGISPFDVAQCTFSVSGKLGYEAKLISAVLTSSKIISEPLAYEKLGDQERWTNILSKVPIMQKIKREGKKDREYYVPGYTKDDEIGIGVRVIGKLRGGIIREHDLLMANAYPRFSTQWATNPWMQLCYFATRQWARLYASQVMLGVITEDEPVEKDITPQSDPNLLLSGNVNKKTDVIIAESKTETINDIGTEDSDQQEDQEKATDGDDDGGNDKTKHLIFNPDIHVQKNGVPVRTANGRFRIKRGMLEQAGVWEKRCMEEDPRTLRAELDKSKMETIKKQRAKQEEKVQEIRTHYDSEAVEKLRRQQLGKEDKEQSLHEYEIINQGDMTGQEIEVVDQFVEEDQDAPDISVDEILMALKSSRTVDEIDQICDLANALTEKISDEESKRIASHVSAALRRIQSVSNA